MGRNRKPTALKIVKGTAQTCRLNPDEPQPEVAIPDPPDYLDGEALQEWNRITPQLETLGIISELDLAIVAGYCLAYANMVNAQKEWRGLGSPLTTLSTNGIEMVHPLLTIGNQSREQVRKLGNELGITPASRSKVSGKGKGKAKDPWGEM